MGEYGETSLLHKGLWQRQEAAFFPTGTVRMKWSRKYLCTAPMSQPDGDGSLPNQLSSMLSCSRTLEAPLGTRGSQVSWPSMYVLDSQGLAQRNEISQNALERRQAVAGENILLLSTQSDV